jgi:phage tail tape-measure protein
MAKMSALQDPEMERLSDLLAQGTLRNAREIARLLRVELGEQRDPIPKNESLQSYLGLLSQMTDRAAGYKGIG